MFLFSKYAKIKHNKCHQETKFKKNNIKPVVVHSYSSNDIPSLKKELNNTWDDIKHICKEMPNSRACVAAWDKYWDLEQAYYKKVESEEKDPLEIFCQENPDADECRLYDV
jgi:hypothetical protein